ncbi:MAG: S-layer homology domain-containing protein, partial [Clostridia bacterium]|nr:S-layer homology domain-containing protein [Clostridia bacterium]
MKFTKRITSMLLIFVFAFTSMYMVAPAANFSDVAEEYAHYEAITALVDQGIINGYEDGTFKPENTITRAEFSKLLAVSSAPTGYAFSATTTNFPDIADMNAAHGWAVPYISYAVSTKAINGYTDGTFQPGNPVTYGEAIKMIVCTLGYGPVADTTLTPWYQGYLNIANQIGLTKNAAAVGDAPANRGIVAHLIYNMLDCPVLTQTGVDALGNPIYSTATGDGSSFGDSKDNAKSAEGIVMGVTDYSLDATAVGRNKVQIDDQVFSLSSKLDMDTVKSYIGYRVQYSYSGSAGKQEITKITRLNGYNSSVTIEPWQIANITSNYIEYFENERAEAQGDVTRVTYGSRPYVIYNGVPVNPADIGAGFNVASYFDVETGSITLFSNDSNEKTAELVIVESYKTYLVYTSPSVADGVTTIYDKNAAYTGLSALAIDEADVSSVKKVSAKGATPALATMGAIVSKTVVSVAVPYGTTEGTNVMVSSAYATGDVTELSSDYETIVIGSQSYELSPYYRTLLANNCPEAGFTNGDNVKIYFDYLGRIVYSEKNETADPYGLLIAYADGGSMDSVASLGIMTTGSKFLEHQMKSTIKVNGVSMNSDQAIESLKASALISDGNYIIQPVKYRTSGNLFTSIEVLTAASAQETLKYTT